MYYLYERQSGQRYFSMLSPNVSRSLFLFCLQFRVLGMGSVLSASFPWIVSFGSRHELDACWETRRSYGRTGFAGKNNASAKSNYGDSGVEHRWTIAPLFASVDAKRELNRWTWLFFVDRKSIRCACRVTLACYQMMMMINFIDNWFWSFWICESIDYRYHRLYHFVFCLHSFLGFHHAIDRRPFRSAFSQFALSLFSSTAPSI